MIKSKIDIFIEKSIKTHGNKYDYSKVVYIDNRTSIIITCPKHGDFYQRPHSHYNRGQGCPECAKENKSIMFRSNNSKFIDQAKIVHGNIYDYSKVEYGPNGHNHKVILICNKHGEFLQTPHAHLMGQGCPICKNSIGETKIRVFLEKNKIEFEQYKTFDSCINKRFLRFDFYLPKFNICIEYDGKQHFLKESKFYSEDIIINDQIKNEYCIENNINLIRISYLEYKNIYKIMSKKLNIIG